MSHHLNEKQKSGLNKLGDIMLPGDSELPSFSKAACGSEVDRVLDYLPKQDLEDLKMLLMIFGYCPVFLLRFVLVLIEWGSALPGPIGAPLRFVRLGIRGLIMSLYYGHPRIHAVIQYKVGVYTGDITEPVR